MDTLSTLRGNYIPVFAMTRHIRPVLLAATLLAAPLMPAQATTLSVSDIFSQFNVITFGNFSTTADVEGRTVVGGNLTGGATFDMSPGGAAASSFASLTVYGNATAGGNAQIQNGNGLAIAGSNNVNWNLNAGTAAYIGGSNTGNLSFTAKNDSVTVVGSNSGNITIAGGTLYLGGNSGTISANGASTISINGNNTSNLNLNGSSTVSINGSNSGTVGLNGGSVTYTGNRGNMNLNGGATATKVGSLALSPPASTLPSFATLFQQPLTQLSTQLGAMTANSTVTSRSGTIAFNATPDSTGTAVFNISSALLTPNTNVTMNLNGATTVIINVTVSGCVNATCPLSLPGSLHFNNPTGYADTVLWNFVNASTISFGQEFGGSVLAPFAAVTNSTPLDGTLVASSFIGTGEIHSYGFDGTIPTSYATAFISATSINAPEPGSLALIGSGFVALGAIRRRRRSNPTV